MFSDNLEKALVKKTTHDVLEGMLVEEAKFYVTNEPIDPDNVDKVGKVVISSVVGQVPVFGSLLSGLLDLFWPGGKDDDWGSMRPMVEALIDDKNGQQDAENNRNLLKGLLRVLQDLLALPDSSKFHELHDFVNRTTEAVPSFVDNKSPWYSLPYLVRFGTLRLSALWTRWHFCDNTISLKQYYRGQLVDGVYELLRAVSSAKSLCIDRRIGRIKKFDNGSIFELEDPYTQAKLRFVAGDSLFDYVQDQDKTKVQDELERRIRWVYGEELDLICAQSKLWEQFLPDYVPKVRVEHYRKNRGWLWSHITPQTTPFDSSSYRQYGELSKINFYHVGDPYYGNRQIVGLDLFYGDVAFHIGGRQGACSTMEIGKDEVILRAEAHVLTGEVYELDKLETIDFTKACPTIDKQGRMKYNYSVQCRIAQDDVVIPRYGVTVTTFFHDGEVSKPYPTCMISAVGWSYDHDEEGYIGLFQPVFGCVETVGKNGLSTWSFEQPGFS